VTSASRTERPTTPISKPSGFELILERYFARVPSTSAVTQQQSPPAESAGALREIRDFTYLLHPKTLLADGLKFAIEHFVKGSCSHVAGGQSRCRFGSRQVVVCGAALSAENYSRSPDERFPSCESDACVRSVLDEMGRFNDQAS